MDKHNTIFDRSSQFTQPSALTTVTTAGSRDVPHSLGFTARSLQHLLSPSFVEDKQTLKDVHQQSSRAALLRANLTPLSLENRKNAKRATMSLYGCDNGAGGVGVKLEAPGSALIDDTLSTSNLNSLNSIPTLSPTTASYSKILSLPSAVVESRDEVETSTSLASKALLPEDSLSHSQKRCCFKQSSSFSVPLSPPQSSSEHFSAPPVNLESDLFGIYKDTRSRRPSVSDTRSLSEDKFQDAIRTETSAHAFYRSTGPNEMHETPLPDTSLIVGFVHSQNPSPSAHSNHSGCSEFQAPRSSFASACEHDNSDTQPSSFTQSPYHPSPSYKLYYDPESEQSTNMEEQRDHDRVINKVLADPLRMRMNFIEVPMFSKLATPPPIYIKDEGVDLGIPSASAPEEPVHNLPDEEHNASFLSGSDEGSVSTVLPTPRSTPSPPWCSPESCHTVKTPRSLSNPGGHRCSLPSPAPSTPTSPVVATSSFTPKRNFIQTSYDSKPSTKRGRPPKLAASTPIALKSAKLAQPSSVRYMPYPNTAVKVERFPKKERVPIPPSTSNAVAVTVEHSVKSEKTVKKAIAVQNEKSKGLPKPKKRKLLPSERAAEKARGEPKGPKLLAPLNMLQATKWATTLDRLHYMSKKLERVKLDDGQFLLKTLEEIEERREQFDCNLLQASGLARSIRKLCHRTRYDEAFDLGIKTKARLISDYIRVKFDLQPAPS